MSNSYKINVSPPLHSTSLMLNKKDDDVRSYSEQNSFSNGCLRIGKKKKKVISLTDLLR